MQQNKLPCKPLRFKKHHFSFINLLHTHTDFGLSIAQDSEKSSTMTFSHLTYGKWLQFHIFNSQQHHYPVGDHWLQHQLTIYTTQHSLLHFKGWGGTESWSGWRSVTSQGTSIKQSLGHLLQRWEGRGAQPTAGTLTYGNSPPSWIQSHQEDFSLLSLPLANNKIPF